MFNFDPSILWHLVFIRRHSANGTLDIDSRVVLLVTLLKLCAISYLFIFFLFQQKWLNIGTFIYLQKSWVTKQQFQWGIHTVYALRSTSQMLLFVSCWMLAFPCAVTSCKSVLCNTFLPRVSYEFLTISFSFQFSFLLACLTWLLPAFFLSCILTILLSFILSHMQLDRSIPKAKFASSNSFLLFFQSLPPITFWSHTIKLAKVSDLQSRMNYLRAFGKKFLSFSQIS